MITPADLIGPVTDEDIEWACQLLKLQVLDEPRRAFLKSLTTLDVSACPGSGKTTLIVAKLAILARKWKSTTRGICVLSHTNVAREEIAHRLGNTDVGQRLLGYPHFIDTIHGFVNRFLATPWLLSAGYRVTAIDNDLTTKVRRRHLNVGDYFTLNAYLEKKFISFGSLRLGCTNFATPLVNTAFPSGTHTKMYQLAAAALRHAAEQGYFCYDEIFLFGEALLAQQPDLPAILQSRFPFVLVDEMQDTSEQQNDFLRQLFPRDVPLVCIQRVGDPNQAIFEGGIKPVVDAFPDTLRCVSIADSFRFDASIGALATPFAYHPVQPNGLKGVRPTTAPGQGMPHTIFVFPDNDTSGVLDAFGHHVLATLPASMLTTSVVSAVGAVHKPFPDVKAGHKQYPKTVAHYWARYQAGASRPTYRPRTFAEAFLAAQALASSGGPLHLCVDFIASAISHLANLMAGTKQVRSSSRRHLQVEKHLADAYEASILYRELLSRFVIGQEPLTAAKWKEVCPCLRLLGAEVGGGDPNASAADIFLVWPAVAPLPADPNQSASAAVNSYRYAYGNTKVDIQLGSIHMAKGQTHAATLVLETFNQSHFLQGLMPWLLGKNKYGVKCTNDKAMQRLLQIYVAMTRPTHLLCLALRESSLGTGKDISANEEKLLAGGWQVRHLASATNADDGA